MEQKGSTNHLPPAWKKKWDMTVNNISKERTIPIPYVPLKSRAFLMAQFSLLSRSGSLLTISISLAFSKREGFFV